MIAKTAFGVLLLVATAGTASADVSLKDKQQAACYDDVQRLCGQFIPDTDKTEACMLKMKSKVSARCRAYFPN